MFGWPVENATLAAEHAQSVTNTVFVVAMVIVAWVGGIAMINWYKYHR